MASLSDWVVCFRLHTLPLALSTTLLGSFLAAYHYQFSWEILTGTILTTLFLQILSNLANDYGDAENGVDNAERIGPQRSLQSGVISKLQMKKAIYIFVLLSLISGTFLVIEGTKNLHIGNGIILFLTGITAIAAAMKYTMGKNPYGYSGFGDLFVFIFFGLVGVLGTFFLHTHFLAWPELLPAAAIGCFSTGVLNLNNLRDRENDAAFGKKTIVVRLGLHKAKYYHALLLTAGMLSALCYTAMAKGSWHKWIYVITFIAIIRSIVVVAGNEEPKSLYPELKRLSIATLLFAVLFGLGLLV